MHLVGNVWGHIPTKPQIYPSSYYGDRPLGHNPRMRLIPLGHKVSVYGTLTLNLVEKICIGKKLLMYP
jgi:hypothetical protein